MKVEREDLLEVTCMDRNGTPITVAHHSTKRKLAEELLRSLSEKNNAAYMWAEPQKLNYGVGHNAILDGVSGMPYADHAGRPVAHLHLLPDGTHRIIASFRTSAPYAGCFNEIQFILFKFVVKSGMSTTPKLELVCAPGRVEEMVKRLMADGQSKSIVEVEEYLTRFNDTSRFDLRMASDPSDQLIAEGSYDVLAAMSSDLENDGKNKWDFPFLWTCYGCECTQDGIVVAYESSIGNGGVGVYKNDPICETCYEEGACDNGIDGYCYEKRENGEVCSFCMNCAECGVNVEEANADEIKGWLLSDKRLTVMEESVVESMMEDDKEEVYVKRRNNNGIMCSWCYGKHLYNSRVKLIQSKQVEFPWMKDSSKDKVK